METPEETKPDKAEPGKFAPVPVSPPISPPISPPASPPPSPAVLPPRLEAPGAAVAPAEQDEQTRGRLLRAAVTVFDRKGYAAASVREIVEMAGVTKPALYYHFGSKEGVLTAILQAAAREFASAMERGVGRPGTARERLFALCADLHGLFREHVPVVRVAHSVLFGPVEGAPQFDFSIYNREMERAVRRIVEDGQLAGELSASVSTADIALVVLGVVGISATRHLQDGVEPIDLDSMRRVLGLVLDGAQGQQRQQGEPRS